MKKLLNSIDFEHLSVLIAEDNEVSRKLLVKLLETVGAKPIEAENGVEAVEKTASDAPSVILMDLQMPEMDGYEATTKIRQSGVTCPIIAVTAASAEEGNKLKTHGFDGYCPKPVIFDKLIEDIKSALEATS